MKKDEKNSLCEDIAGNGCGLKKVLNIIGGKWKIMILCVIDNNEVVRYGTLKRSVYKITNTMLSQSLKELEQDGLIVREEDSEIPNKVVYYLTDIGCTLRPVIESMQKWGSEYKKYRKLLEKTKGE